MSATKIKTRKTTVTQYETQELSLNAIELLPAQLQARAELDPDWASQYAVDMRKGDDFPAVTVFRIPPDRLVCADGYHRIDAAQSIGLRSIRAQVRGGTMEEAVLAAVEANQAAFHRGRPFRGEDQKHAAEIMIRNETLRIWSDTEIAKRCGLRTRTTVVGIRMKLRDGEGIPLPHKVMKFSRGIPTGELNLYRIRKCNSDQLPSICAINPSRPKPFGCVAGFDGKDNYFPGDVDSAQRALVERFETRTATNASLKNGPKFNGWLMRRGVYSVGRPRGTLGGYFIGDALVFPVADADRDAALKGVGLAVLCGVESDDVGRVILVGYFGQIGGPSLASLARLLTPPIEFMTPEEVVAEFGPKGGAEPPPGE